MTLGNTFARELPELALAWQADDFPEAHLLLLNERVAAELGLDPASLRGEAGVKWLVGNLIPAGATPVAQVYSGHQFGHYSPRLGDGRALLLGEVSDPQGQLRDVHLKGSGRTPLARNGDGLALVGPMVREYVVSEAMHALGVPTTCSLAVTATGRPVQREELLPGAVLTRVASSHVRVGSFSYAAATADAALVRRLVQHATERHYPELSGAENPALGLLQSVIAAQASLIAQWMLLGFVHGVMNTDNMTISGETIDYGPCAFMDAFDPNAVYSSIDSGGRYAYGNQPIIAEWNLARFAEALVPAIHDDPEQAVAHAQEALGSFRPRYRAAWTAGMLAKLGLRDDVDTSVAGSLISDLIDQMKASRVDYTSFFRGLSGAARGNSTTARDLLLDPATFDTWLQRWTRLEPDPDAMNTVNPAYIPRNHLVEEALDAATAGDLGPVQQLLDAVTDPYTKRPGLDRYADPAPDSFGPYRTFCGT